MRAEEEEKGEEEEEEKRESRVNAVLSNAALNHNAANKQEPDHSPNLVFGLYTANIFVVSSLLFYSPLLFLRQKGRKYFFSFTHSTRTFVVVVK